MFAYFAFLGIVLIVLLPFALIRAEFVARRVRREQLERRRMIEQRLKDSRDAFRLKMQLESEARKKRLDDGMARIKAMIDHEQTKSEDIKRRYRRY
jgi:guanylate kinase